jgi:hypothetical protein
MDTRLLHHPASCSSNETRICLLRSAQGHLYHVVLGVKAKFTTYILITQLLIALTTTVWKKIDSCTAQCEKKSRSWIGAACVTSMRKPLQDLAALKRCVRHTPYGHNESLSKRRLFLKKNLLASMGRRSLSVSWNCMCLVW